MSLSASMHWILGWVGRMQAVKAPDVLVDAFIDLLRREPRLRDRVRLVMAGDGPLRKSCEDRLTLAGAADLAWLPGERTDVDVVMRGLHCFALPSLAEGISNTILEAMATGLPVVASQVGGNVELVQRTVTGELVPPGDPFALSSSLAQLALQPERAAAMGRAARAEIERRYSLEAMISGYRTLYESAFPSRQAIRAKA
jgi:glycosyltransferase involved in cell wall biosynthesis